MPEIFCSPTQGDLDNLFARFGNSDYKRLLLEQFNHRSADGVVLKSQHPQFQNGWILWRRDELGRLACRAEIDDGPLRVLRSSIEIFDYYVHGDVVVGLKASCDQKVYTASTYDANGKLRYAEMASRGLSDGKNVLRTITPLRRSSLDINPEYHDFRTVRVPDESRLSVVAEAYILATYTSGNEESSLPGFVDLSKAILIDPVRGNCLTVQDLDHFHLHPRQMRAEIDLRQPTEKHKSPYVMFTNRVDALMLPTRLRWQDHWSPGVPI